MSAQKALQGSETETRVLLGGTEENSVSQITRALILPFFTCLAFLKFDCLKAYGDISLFRCLPKEWLTPHALESSLESRNNGGGGGGVGGGANGASIAPEEASTATTESTLTDHW